MISYNELYERLGQNDCSNEDIIESFKYEKYGILVRAISKLLEKDFYDDFVLKRLEELSKKLVDAKLIGPWQFGHYALGILSLLSDERYKTKYCEIYNGLDEDDKELVALIIRAEAYK